jgi:RNA polymerase-binding transcription factor DksA
MAKSTKKKSAAAKRPATKSKAASKKPTAKKAVAKKASPKKPMKKATKKTPAKKTPAQKAAKKASAKKPVKKASAKKPAKKASAKKPAKKASAKKPAKKASAKKPVKKVSAKKPAKKVSAKKPPAKKKTAAEKAPARRLLASRNRVRQRPVRPGNGQPNFRGKKRKYYEMLVTLRDQLVDEVRTLSAQSLTSNKQAGEELADIGSDSFLREMGLGVMSDEGHRIQLIREAIERLHGRGFGVCLDCGQDIQEARLEAIPYAKLCVQCKTRRETARAEGIDLDAELELTE